MQTEQGNIQESQFDEKGALGRVDNDRELLSDVIQAFLDTIDADLEDLERQIDGGDAVMARRVAHRIKGGFGAVGAGILAAQAMKIEAVPGDDCAAMVPLAREVRVLTRQLNTELQAFLSANGPGH